MMIEEVHEETIEEKNGNMVIDEVQDERKTEDDEDEVPYTQMDELD